MTTDIALCQIDPNPFQTRLGEPDEQYLSDLAEDIRKNGLMQNPVGRIVVGGNVIDPAEYGGARIALYDEPAARVQIAFGHNRLAAFRWLGKETMPVAIRYLTDLQMAEMSWSENEKRRDVTPYERALALKARIDHFGLSHAKAAEVFGLSRSAVSNILRLLILPQEILDAMAEGEISERQAMAMVPVYETTEDFQREAEVSIRRIANDARNGLSSDEIRKNVDYLLGRFARDLDKANWSLNDCVSPDKDATPEEGELIHADICRDCPSRIKSRNLCTGVQCYDLKMRWSRAEYLQQAAAADPNEKLRSVPIMLDYNEYDGRFTHWHWQPEFATQVTQTGCENLRWVYNAHRDGTKERFAPGSATHPHAELVCSKSRCQCAAGLQAMKAMKQSEQAVAQMSNNPNDDNKAHAESQDSPRHGVAQPPAAEPLTQEALAAAAKQARADKKQHQALADAALDAAAQMFATLLDAYAPAAWRVLLEEYVYYGRPKPESLKTIDIGDARREFALYTLRKAILYADINPRDVPALVVKFFERNGLPLPKLLSAPDADPADTLDAIFGSEPEFAPLPKL